MNQFMEVNDGEMIPHDKIKRLQPMTEYDVNSLKQLNPDIDTDKFSTRLERSNGRSLYIQETIDEISSSGSRLLQVEENVFIPKENFKSAKNLTPKDRDNFKTNTGRDVPDGFKAQVTTEAGNFMVKTEAENVMKNIRLPYQPQTVLPENGIQNVNGNKATPAIDPKAPIKDQRNAVMAAATPKAKSNGREHPRER